MACRHHDAGRPAEVDHGEIQAGRGDKAEINDMQSGGAQPFNQRAVKRRRTEAAIPGNRNVAAIPRHARALPQKIRAAGPAHFTGKGGVKTRPHHASDVVGAKGSVRGGGKRHVVFSLFPGVYGMLAACITALYAGRGARALALRRKLSLTGLTSCLNL